MDFDKDKNNLLSLVKKFHKDHIANRTDSNARIKYAGPVYDEKEMLNGFESLIDSFYSGWFSLGRFSKEFEKKFSSIFNIKNIILANSGSSANLLSVAALHSLGYIKSGDEAITLASTFPTTVNPLILYKLKPILIDTVLPSYTIDVDKLETAITNKTKLIMIPHINGSPNDMKRIMEIARKHNIYVIEDCCDALGSKFDRKFVGTFGNIATFSFYGAHHISTGEGGAATTSDDDIANALTSLRDWGRQTVSDYDLKKGRKLTFQKTSSSLPEDYEERYTYVNIGYNLKPLDLQLAIGLPQLDKLEKFGEIRKRNYSIYMNALKDVSEFILPEALPKADPSWFVFPVVIKENAKFKRLDLIKYLEKKGIETRPILAGNIHKQPAYAKIKFGIKGKLKNSDLILRNGLFFGIYQGLDETKIRYIIESIKSFIKIEVR